MSEHAPWPLSETVARAIAARRRRAGLNRDDFAKRCRDRGAPDNLTGAALANIETGRKDATGRRRRDVTIEELAIFARVLDVPPVLLLFDVGHVDEVEVLPGSVVPAWRAAEWFTGEGPFLIENGAGGLRPADLDAWRRNAAPVALYREHSRLLAEWGRSVAFGVGDDEEDVASQMRALWERRHEIEADLRRVRETMRVLGLTLPHLSEKLMHIDEAGT